MCRKVIFGLVVCTMISSSALGEVRGTYVEARTCQVYTGPCFANGEVGLAGKNAVMSWHVVAGEQDGVNLEGLSVAVIARASHTLGFRGFDDAKTMKCVILIDEKANSEQEQALQRFALWQTGIAVEKVLQITKVPIEMKFDEANLTASLDVGDVIKLRTRKARPGDCICSNEAAYYPPLAKLKGSVPGVTIEGDVTARRLGTRWSIPDSRTAYLGLFESESNTAKLASR